MINLELNLQTAVAVRHLLFKEQEIYTYDSTCVPQRIVDIRSAVLSIDNQIEEELKNEQGSTES